MIRKACREDAIHIVEINIKEWKTTYQGIFSDELLNDLDAKREESIIKCCNKIQEYIVSKQDNKVVGFIRYGMNKKGYSKEYGEIYALYVDQEYQGKRIGRELVDYAKKLMKQKYSKLLVSTLVQNKANEFYQKVRFTKIGHSNFSLEDKNYEENLYCIDLI